MKILCFGTLDKFSRFYLKIKSGLDSSSVFRIYSLHFSGFLYTLIRFQFSCFLPLRAWVLALKNKKRYLEIINNHNKYKDINYKNLIRFHLKLNASTSKKRLLFQALAYIDLLEKVFVEIQPNLIILIGDSRLSIETSIALAKKFNIKTYYIEQGPFNSTFFNNTGVNANARFEVSLDTKNISSIEKKVITFITKPESKKYRRSFIYRGIDYLLSKMFERTFIFPPDLKGIDTFPTLFKSTKKAGIVKSDKEKNTFLFILQVPMDVNMIYHSPHFRNHFSALKAVHQSLPKKAQLIIREHPLYRGKYETELYEYAQINNLDFDTNISLKESLKFTQVVIVNNSTAGIEAIALKKKVVVLGNSYYDHPKVCIKYDGKTDLKDVLIKAINFSTDNNSISLFIHSLIQNNLVNGHIKDLDLIAARIISNKIETEFNNQNN